MSLPARFQLITRLSLAVVLSGILAACGGRKIFVPPAGPGEAVADASAIWEQASRDCRDVHSLVSAVRVSGRVGGTRLWPLTVEAAMLANQSIYLGATASGRSIFLLAGSTSRATLWLRTDDRAVTADPVEILHALVGVSLSADDMLNLLSGCVARSASVTSAVRHGALTSIESSAGRVFLEQRAGQWAVRAFETPSLTAEFVPAGRATPQDIWIWSRAGTSAASLHLTVTEREVNGNVPAEVFRVPDGALAAKPMTLDELASMWKNRFPSPGQ